MNDSQIKLISENIGQRINELLIHLMDEDEWDFIFILRSGSRLSVIAPFNSSKELSAALAEVKDKTDKASETSFIDGESIDKSKIN